VTGRFLPGTQIEVIRERSDRGSIRFVVFDFDGTISLIREGWQGIMIPMMVEALASLRTGETEEELRTAVVDFVDRLTGQQTIYQMIQLVDEVRKRGGTPLAPLAYKRMYHDRLLTRIAGRVAGLKGGTVPPEDLVVPGSFDLLENLRSRGVTLFLASGTDEGYVKDEAGALGVSKYFNGGLYGALDQYEKFSKRMLIADLFRAHNLRGHELAVFGDGYVEIENAREAGGLAVGVASDEARRRGIDGWKRGRLIGAGADLIVPDHREQDRVVAYLFGEM
jgi:phosphoglycolate phosphatase-like HAD superfamily hydrolase